MMIVKRDIEVMGWILEQKFMTVEQVRRVFWNETEAGKMNSYRRLLKLYGGGYLKRSRSSIYRNVLYLVTAMGLKGLRAVGRDRGLSESADVDSGNYKHDVAVTDIRIMFHKWGYDDWASERVIEAHEKLRRVPDGMVYHRGKGYAIEFESTQKSKSRYEDIFIEYELERKIEGVIYIVDTSVLLAKLCKMASSYLKIRFVHLKHLQEQKLDSVLVSAKAQGTLAEFLNTGVPE